MFFESVNIDTQNRVLNHSGPRKPDRPCVTKFDQNTFFPGRPDKFCGPGFKTRKCVFINTTLKICREKIQSAMDRYQGTCFGFHMHMNRYTTKLVKMIYERDRLQQLLSELGRVLTEYGCTLVGVDLQEFLQHITGFSRFDRPIILKGRKFPLRGKTPPGYDYVANWMLEDRNLIDALMNIVFSRVDLVARNSQSIELTPILNGAATKPGSKTYTKAVIFYSVSPVSETNIGKDFVRVTIDGDGTGRKTFRFDHTKDWMINRYRVAPARTPADGVD